MVQYVVITWKPYDAYQIPVLYIHLFSGHPIDPFMVMLLRQPMTYYKHCAASTK